MENLLTDKQDHIRWLMLNRPERRNALDRDTIYALKAALAESARDADTRLVVLTGAGGAFSSGADLLAAPSQPTTPGEELTEDGFNAVIRMIWNLSKPVIAAVDGVATGYGCSLALAADIRLASPAARFSLIFVKRGLTIDGGASYFLPRLAGLRGMEMALTGEMVDATEAANMGLVNRILSGDNFREQVAAYASRLAKNAPLALAAIKASIHNALGAGLGDVLTAEMAEQRKLLQSEDVKEGIRAFREKRDPVYTGR